MSLFIKNQNNWCLSENLIFSTTTRLEQLVQSALQTIADNEALSIDLSKLDKIDSAGVSLLLSIIHHCQHNNILLKFNNFNSQDAQQLITIHGLRDIFTPILSKESN